MAKEEKKAERLFVAEYEYADEWTMGHRSILSATKNGDFYLIFQTGKKIPPTLDCQEIICAMGQKKKLYTCEMLPDNDYYQYIKQEIINHSDSNTYIYFLNMESAYLSLKDEFGYAQNVQSKKNYKVGRKKARVKTKTAMSNTNKDNSELFDAMNSMTVNPNINTQEHQDMNDIIQKENNIEQNAENSTKKNQNTRTQKEALKKENQKDKKTAIDNLEESFSAANNRNHMPDEQNKEKDSQNGSIGKKDLEKQNKTDANDRTTQEKQIKNTEDADVHKNDENVSSKPNPNPRPSEPRPHINRNSNQQRPHMQGGTDTQPKNSQGGVQGTAKSNRQHDNRRGNAGGKGMAASQASNLSLQQIEDLIFGTQQVQQDFSHVYTEVDDNKARMSDSLIDRFSEEVCKLAKNVSEYGFNRADYVLVLTTLVKSESYEDFVSSWDVAKSGYRLGIDERVYMELYNHAVYCSKVFDMLYKEDKFK